MNHTPGPWEVVRFSDEPNPVIIGPNGDERITTVSGNQDDAANARLIAAAPEMLAMLKAANDAFYVQGTRKALQSALDGSRDLIRKAEGRTE